MNQTVLIALGVGVFAMTVVAVLIFFYSMFAGLAAAESSSIGITTVGVPDLEA